ncbi:hypothetical protein ACFLQS_01720 [Actinomycetota bacterium]
MNDIKKIDYIIRVETTDKKHSVVEKLTQKLVHILKLNETEIEYFKKWYVEENVNN